MRHFNSIAALLAFWSSLTAAEVQFSGTLQQEWSYAYELDKTQKTQTLINMEWQADITDNIYLTTIIRYKSDFNDELSQRDEAADSYFFASKPYYIDSHQQLELRELYADFYLGDFAWRIGKQQIVWGQADGLKVLDQINPQDFDEFILDSFEDSRIPLWIAAVEFPLYSGQLQLLWIADSSSHQIPDRGSFFAVTNPVQVPPFSEELGFSGNQYLDDDIHNGDYGLRWSSFINGWDVSVNYLYHYLDFASYSFTSDQKNLQGEFTRSQLIGGTLSNSLGDFTLRAEIGLQTRQQFLSEQGDSIAKPELAAVLGLDWSGLSDTLLSGQLFNSYIHHYQDTIIRDKNNYQASLLWQQNFANETWQWSMLAIMSLQQGDSLIRPKLRYSWQEDIDLWLSADIFSGGQSSLFGQFKQKDSVNLGFEWGF